MLYEVRQVTLLTECDCTFIRFNYTTLPVVEMSLQLQIIKVKNYSSAICRTQPERPWLRSDTSNQVYLHRYDEYVLLYEKKLRKTFKFTIFMLLHIVKENYRQLRSQVADLII